MQDRDKWVGGYSSRSTFDGVSWDGESYADMVGTGFFSDLASDHHKAIVTRAEWESERARIAGKEAAQKASAANKDGWIRHRGGKCPVEAGVSAEIRMRDGFVGFVNSGSVRWNHTGHAGDIMAYRLHKPAEQVATKVGELTIEVTANTEGVHEAIEDMQMQIDQTDGPIKWRDRIAEIDVEVQALTTERDELVQKLASEGFALIGCINELLTDAAQKHDDMGDPKNWKEGDFIESVSDDQVDISIGAKYQIIDDCNGRVVRFRDDYGDIRDRPADLYIFHSRPSA